MQFWHPSNKYFQATFHQDPLISNLDLVEAQNIYTINSRPKLEANVVFFVVCTDQT
jgi:hypothetical protein